MTFFGTFSARMSLNSIEAASWKAKYESVVSLVEPQHVEAAEMICKAAMELSHTSSLSFTEAVENLVYVAKKLKNEDVKHFRLNDKAEQA